MANEYGRNIKDASALCTQTKAMPAAGASNSTTAFDLIDAGWKNENLEMQWDIAASPAHTTVNNNTFALQDSSDNSSFAAVDPAISTTSAGVAVTGGVAKEIRFRLPPNVRRYVRVLQTAGATDDQTAVTNTYRLLT